MCMYVPVSILFPDNLGGGGGGGLGTTLVSEYVQCAVCGSYDIIEYSIILV